MNAVRKYDRRDVFAVTTESLRHHIFPVDIHTPGSAENSYALLREISPRLHVSGRGGGVAEGAYTVDFSADIKAGQIEFVPFSMTRGSLESNFRALPWYGLRPAAPFEMLCWLQQWGKYYFFPDSVSAIEERSDKKRILSIKRHSCGIMWVVGRRCPDEVPHKEDETMYLATVANVPLVLKKVGKWNIFTPQVPGLE